MLFGFLQRYATNAITCKHTTPFIDDRRSKTGGKGQRRPVVGTVGRKHEPFNQSIKTYTVIPINLADGFKSFTSGGLRE
jgi:hypothetical protein